MKMNRGACFFVTLFILLILFTAVPYRSNAAGEATGVHHDSSGLIEYLWWNVAPSHRKFYDNLQLPAHQRHLTGDPDEWRSKLSGIGVTPTLTYATDMVGNPYGGNRHSFTYCDNIGLNIDFDLEKLFGFKGSKFNVSGSWRNGTSLSNDYIGNIFNVQQLFGGQTYRLVDLYWEQSLWEDLLNFRLGRIAVGDEFLASPLYWNYVNNGIDANPVGILKNVPGVTAYPGATWGIRTRVRPVKEIYLMAGLYNNDPEALEPKNHGVDFSMKGPLFVIAETGYLRNQKKRSAGLPGNYKIGGYYHNGDFGDFYSDDYGNSYVLSGKSPKTHHGNWGFYILLDQMVYREGGPGTEQGLTPFVSLLFAPDKEINQLPFFMNGGLIYRGLIPGRERDTAAFGLVYGSFSNDLKRHQKDKKVGVQRYELVLELNYNIEVAKWLHIIPDIQYVINPGGTGDIPDALVLGFQLSVSL